MDKTKLLNIINRIAQIIADTCQTDEEIEQVKDGIEKQIELFKSIPQR
jgi:hypothetical protein